MFRACSIVLIATAVGCAGPFLPQYHIGPDTLYRQDVQTVHVPIVEYEIPGTTVPERLTEAVVKEIEMRTPFKVVGPANPDSVLRIRLVETNKALVVPSPTDEARMIQTRMRVESTWTNRITGCNVTMRDVPVPEAVALAQTWTDFAPEAGQSKATAEQTIINRLARQIVNQMESDW